MCGIFALIETSSIKPTDDNREQVFQKYKSTIESVTSKLLHRGPDSNDNNLIIDPNFDKSILMIHTRLKITGDNTSQPLVNKNNTLFLIINGEIFNWRSLEKELDYKCTKSDCEIIFPLYERYKQNIPEMLKKLQGQFSFFLYDIETKHILIARDPIGVTPLYIGYKYNSNSNSSNNIITRFVVSSELKCLTMVDPNSVDPNSSLVNPNSSLVNPNSSLVNPNSSLVDNIKVFYPRSYLYTSLDSPFNPETPVNYYNFYEMFSDRKDRNSIINPIINPILNPIQQHNIIMQNVREKMIQSVRTRLRDVIDYDLDFGVLLSGGLDSSLITSLVVSIADEMGYTKKIKTFSIGVDATVPDLVAARTVAEYLNTEHHEYNFTVDEGINNLENVIWYAESYDCTTIRASTPMYLLTKRIKQDYPNLKVLFSGELSDELLCYLYGANAPSEQDFQIETINLVSNVHSFDCLRANKMCMANSIEVRVPFADIDYVNYILGLHPKWKTFGKTSDNHIEKQILRDSFVGFLPKSILYRKKEQFSDGVSSLNDNKNNWIHCLKQYCESKYSDLEFNNLKNHYVYNRPTTKEHLLYRTIFCKLFNNTSYKNTSEFTVKMWEPKWSESKDPSGRVQNYWVPN
jgi:asparagine synthase (glutamine-hydrolysing)